MNAPDYFIPNRDARAFYPLRSYLRAPPASVAEKYIDALTVPGDLVLDPFACAPTVARVAQQMGRRAIAIESDPLWSWLARAMAALPPAAEIDAALARLGDALKDDAPLRAHISQLYTKTCAGCQKPTSADYFVHARGAGPMQRHYTCVHCGATRDDPATEEDLTRAKSFDPHGLHYHLAFERVAPEGGLHAERIHKLLDVYTPRNLYALVTLTQKTDSLFRGAREHNILLLLLLHLLDCGTSFYADAALDTYAQLTRHKQYVEFNLWREIEIAARELGRGAPALDLADAPADVLYSESQAFVGRGSARALAENVPPHAAALVLATLPSRRVAVWALSYFWGAWILGRAAMQSLAPFLDSRKDTTWERRWYSDLLVQSLSALTPLLRGDGHAVFVFSESWHEVIETLLLAGAGARLDLETLLFQPRLGDFPHREFDDIRGEYRMAFSPSPVKDGGGAGVGVEPRIRISTLAAAEEVLARRGEPLAFSWVHHAAYARLAHEGLLAKALNLKSSMPPARMVHNAVLAGLTEGYARDFDHYESREQLVWMRRGKFDPPLIERVDDAVREMLARGASLAREELEDVIYRQFPGDLTPEAGLIELCAAAYADERDGMWHWRAEDADAKSHALDLLARLGERLGYAVTRPDVIVRSALRGAEREPKQAISTAELGIPFDCAQGMASQKLVLSEAEGTLAMTPCPVFDLIWQSNGDLAHAFLWRERARFADLAQIHIAPACGYLVVPETQVALLLAKVRCLPHLADAFHEAGWHFVRVPFAERLLAQETIGRNDLIFVTGLEPPSPERGTQLEMFDDAS